MLREFTTFENNADGGDVHILFDKTAMNRAPKKGITLKTVLFLLTAVVFLLIFLNIVTGFPSWGRHNRDRKDPSDPSGQDLERMRGYLRLFFEEKEVNFTWTTDFINEELLFEFTFNDTIEDDRWLLMAFTGRGKVENADYCMYRAGNVSDGYVEMNDTLKVDKSQDCLLVLKDSHKFSFKRKWHTCDVRDYSFKEETTQFFFKSGVGAAPTQFVINSFEFHYARFLARSFQSGIEEDAVLAFNVTIPNATVTPTDVQVYYCSIQKLTDLDADFFNSRQHLVRWDPIVSPENERFVKGIEVLACSYAESDSIAFNGSCTAPTIPLEAKTCSLPLASWAPGQPGFEFPKKTGYPLGAARPWILVKVLYQNMAKDTFVDNSGLLLTFSKEKRQHDAGILVLGVSPVGVVGIPPQTSQFNVNSFCVSACSDKMGSDGVTVFGGHYMAGFSGTSVSTTLYRDGKRLVTLTADASFYPDYHPSQRVISVKMDKGDVLMTTCGYSTADSRDWKIISQASSTETCTNYIYYYPASTVSTCTSTVDPVALNEWLSAKTPDNSNSSNQTVVDRFQQVKIDDATRMSLTELYGTAALSVECLDPDAKPFTDREWSPLARPALDGKTVHQQTTVSAECPSIQDSGHTPTA